MDAMTLSEAAKTRICTWLAAEQVDSSYLAFVVRHLQAEDSTWRWCCGSNCDPCVQRLGRVVDQTRQFLGQPPPVG